MCSPAFPKMESSARSRSPHRHRGQNYNCVSLNEKVQVFVRASEQLLELRNQGQEIPLEALAMCKMLLTSARTTPVSDAPPLERILSFTQDKLEESLDSRAACQLVATSRRFSIEFQSKVQKDREMFQWVLDAPNYAPSALISPQRWQYHSSLMLYILNGNDKEVEFILQLGSNVNRREEGHDACGSGGCDMCCQSGSKLLQYTFYEVACIMATSDTPSPCRQRIRDLMHQYGGHTTRPLTTKRRLLRHLHESFDHEPQRCRLVEARALDEYD